MILGAPKMMVLKMDKSGQLPRQQNIDNRETIILSIIVRRVICRLKFLESGRCSASS